VIGEQLEKHDNAWGWRIDVADAILAALHEAGYEVMKRGEYIAIKIDPTMPDNTIEVRSDVDSVRRTFLPDETP
jgi:hypothetical protein